MGGYNVWTSCLQSSAQESMSDARADLEGVGTSHAMVGVWRDGCESPKFLIWECITLLFKCR